MTRRTFTDEILDDRVAAILRRKTPAERLEMTFAMWRLAQELVRGAVRAEHPAWSEEEIRRETARRMSHGAV